MPIPAPLRLSVVIPAYNNAATLDITLDALGRQSMPFDEFEVIVADDGSDPPLAAVVDKHADRIPVSCVRAEENRGRSANRNAGAAQAKADVLVLLDSDTVAHPDLLARHWAFHAARSGRPGVLFGRRFEIDWTGVDALRSGRPLTPAMVDEYRADIRYPDHLIPHYQEDFRRAPWVLGFTHNVSLDRATFEAVNGFDEAMVRWGFEDIEMFYRIFHYHRQPPDLFGWDDDAVAYHLPHYRRTPTMMATVDNINYVVRKHPRYDMEALFGIGSLGRYMGRVRLREDAVRSCRQAGLGMASRLPEALREDLAERRALVVGCGLAGLRLGPGSRTFDHGAPMNETNWHLLGLALIGFKSGQFEVLVNIDLWRYLLPEELWVLVTQARRKADRLLLVASHDAPDPVTLLPLPFATDATGIGELLRTDFDVTVTHHDRVTILAVE